MKLKITYSKNIKIGCVSREIEKKILSGNLGCKNTIFEIKNPLDKTNRKMKITSMKLMISSKTSI